MTPGPAKRTISPPEERFGAFRTSLLLRMAPEDLAHAPESTLARLARAVQVAPGHDVAASFVDFVEAELRTINARVEDCWRERVRGAVAQLDVDLQLDVDQLNLDASVSQAQGADRGLIRVALGAVLALDDIALLALTSPQILVPSRSSMALGDPDTPFELPEAMLVGGEALDRPGRFVDYTDAFRAGELDRAALTHQMPLTPWRLLQASLLSELALAWVLFHERAHWALGHLELLRAAGSVRLHLNEVDQAARSDDLTPSDGSLGAVGQSPAAGRRLPPGAHKALEIQADAQAFLLLCAYAMRLGGACDRYEAVVGDFGAPDDIRVLRSMGFGARLRMCLTAATLACLTFQAARLQSARRDEPTHPPPPARLMSMMVNSLLISPLVQKDEAGDWVLETRLCTNADGEDSDDFRELVHEGLVMALMDIQMLAIALGDEFRPMTENADTASGWAPSDWLMDVTTFWVSDVEDEQDCQTAPGRELKGLRRLDRDLATRLEPIQLRRFGELVDLQLGGIVSASPTSSPSG